jgi:hypothetical protein
VVTVLKLLTDTATVPSIAPAVQSVFAAVGTVIETDVAAPLQSIATQLASVQLPAGTQLSDVANAFTALQAALQAAASLAPGASSAATTALASTTQFANLFSGLLQAAGDLGTASTQLSQIATQIDAIGKQFATLGQ